MNRAASDPIDRVAGVAVPGLQAERALTLAAGSIQGAPPAREFVTDHEDAGGIFTHGVMKRLEGRVIHDEAPQNWFFGLVSRSLRSSFAAFRTRLVKFLPARVSQFEFLSCIRMAPQCFVIVPSPFALNLFERTRRGFNHRRFHEPGRRDDASPEVRHDDPSGIVCLWLDDGSTADDASEA